MSSLSWYLRLLLLNLALFNLGCRFLIYSHVFLLLLNLLQNWILFLLLIIYLQFKLSEKQRENFFFQIQIPNSFFHFLYYNFLEITEWEEISMVQTLHTYLKQTMKNLLCFVWEHLWLGPQFSCWLFEYFFKDFFSYGNQLAFLVKNTIGYLEIVRALSNQLSKQIQRLVDVFWVAFEFPQHFGQSDEILRVVWCH